MDFINLDFHKNYFYVTRHYMENHKKFGLKKASDGKYIDKRTKDKYYFCMESFDYGVGCENAYILDKVFSFEELITLSLTKRDGNDSNNYGAIAMIMQGSSKQNSYNKEFINFLSKEFLINDSLNNDNKRYLLNFFFDIDYSNNKLNENLNYLNLLRKHNEWREMEKEVLSKMNIYFGNEKKT